MNAVNHPDEGWGDPEVPDASLLWGADDGDPPVLDVVDLVVEAAGLVSVFTAQQFHRVEAMRRELLADAARDGYELTEVIERSIRLELAAALSITEAAAGSMIVQADALINAYPAAFDALAHARITPRHASDLVDAMHALEAEYHATVLPHAVALAEAHPVGTFRRLLRNLIDTVRASTLSERHEQAVQSRRVFVQPTTDGMGELYLYAPMVEIHAIHGRITRMAKIIKTHPDEERTLDQLRADIIGDLLIDGTTDLHPADARGIRATVVVTVPALTLLGDAPGGAMQHGVASVEGLGPIPIGRARELCGGASGWMRVLTHPETGIVLSVGRDRYTPPADLRRLVQWRAETCMAPGCNIPASRCEIDHTIAASQGGHTALENLSPFCTGHHTVKHHGRWCVAQIPHSGGAILWTSPTGRRYRVNPERKVPTFRSQDDRATPPPF